jgi:FkbM family methyltransferase
MASPIRKMRSLLRELGQLRPIFGTPASLAFLAQRHFSNESVISIDYRGRALHVNDEAAAPYHLTHSLAKLERLVAAVDDRCEFALDVGANCGWFAAALKARFPDAGLMVIEPDSTLQQAISRNLSGFENWQLVNAAVAERSGRAELYVCPSSHQANSLRRSSVAPYAAGGDPPSSEVETVAIDDLIVRNGWEGIDVLKLDVQGAEARALLGAANVLDRTRQVLVELSFFDFETNPLNVAETLEILNRRFKQRRILNEVACGADVLFHD